MERATGAEIYGCGSPQSSDITLNIQTTTGGNFSISMNIKHTVEHLKKLVSKKLKVSKDRICLLHRERQLRDGTLEENGLMDGSRVILLPSVETGLLSQRPENSVMQALESLNDTQVNDFLSGKSPLNLTMRLGDHMMLIQLQLSTLNSGSLSGARTLRPSTSATKSSSLPKTDKETITQQNTPVKSDDSNTDNKSKQEPRAHHILQKQDIELLQNTFNLYQAMAAEKFGAKAEAEKIEVMDTSHSTESDLSETTTTEDEQSPIKSLSNLVASPITEPEAGPSTTPKKTDLTDLLNLSKSNDTPSTSAMSDKQSAPCLTPDSSLDSDNFTDQSSFLAENPIDEYPMENLFNSVVDKGLFKDQEESMMDREISNLATTNHGLPESTSGTLPSFQSLSEPLKNKRFQYLLHKTSKFKHPIGQNKQRAFMQSVVNKHKKRMQIRQDSHLAQPSTSQTEPYTRKLVLQPSGEVDDNVTPSTSKIISITAPGAPRKVQRSSPTPPVDTRALIEASKNLTQKLKKLSKEVLTNKIDLRTAEEAVRTKLGQGAVIESMKHHGKGIYSGTFSGTLNPALQDRFGRPKRDISTIIHILNDLLCAAPPITLAQKESKHSCGGSSSGSSSSAALVLEEECLCVSECVCGAGRACAACGERPQPGCRDCDAARSLALDNNKTKCKVEQLRFVMQQKKQRREARKKSLPYPSPAKTIANPEQTQEEIDTIA